MPLIEALESRQLLSASPTLHPDHIIYAAAASPTSIDGYTPSQVRQAYGFDQISFANGQMPADGAGQTIAIVDAFNDPALVTDLSVFDQQFDLPAPPSLKVVNQAGGIKLPANDPDWGSEIALDVEWSHAIAPAANILLVETTTDDTANLLAGVNYARTVPGVSVVSLSWGGSETAGDGFDESAAQLALDPDFTTLPGHQGVTFVAAAGDEGSHTDVDWPASSPNVLAVGGTSLTLTDDAGTYGSEVAWSGSTGGYSQIEHEPAFQESAQATGRRSSPDVSYNADPNNGFAMYDSIPDSDDDVGWQVVGGTSAGTPQWAALVAISDQGRALAGSAPLDGSSQTLPALYSIYAVGGSEYAANFHDISSGTGKVRSTKTAGQATVGYDTVTGLGTPKANSLIPFLVGVDPTTATAVTSDSPVAAAFSTAPPASVVGGAVAAVTLRLVDISSTGFAGPVTVSLHLSLDGTLSANDPLLTAAAFGNVSLLAGQYKPLTLRFRFPTTIATANYQLIATVTAVKTAATPWDTVGPLVLVNAPVVDLAVSFAKSVAVIPGHLALAVLRLVNVGNYIAVGTYTLAISTSANPTVMLVHISRGLRLKPGVVGQVSLRFLAPADLTAGSYTLAVDLTSVTSPADTDAANDTAGAATVG